MSSEFQLREIFNQKLVHYISNQVKEAYPAFDDSKFIKTIMKKIDQLSFLDRSNLITDTLIDLLPKEFEISSKILLASLGPELPQDRMAEYDACYIMPLSNYVVKQGIDHFDLSIVLLYEMTKRFTSEGPIRPFLRKYPQKTMEFLRKLTSDSNSHARRLVSEGTRPRLPLSSPLREFQKNPRPVIELLELIKESPELFVRRSIANNLNDISKDNPDIVVETLESWSKIKTPEMNWLIKHALRTLLKQGHPGALALIGFPPNASIEVSTIVLSSDKIKMEGSTEFSFEITSTGKISQNLMIDYIVYFMKANGKQKPKVFKLTTKTIKPAQTLKISKKQEFKNLSTRKQYKGEHAISVQINGKEWTKVNLSII